MQPRQYSMVWMAWCINTSAVSNTCRKHSFLIYTRTTTHIWPPYHQLVDFSYRYILFFFYLLASRSFVQFPLTGVNVAVVSHQRTSVFLLELKKTRNLSNPQLTGELGSVDIKLGLTTWKCLFLNVKYLHMGFPSRRTGTEHTATTTRTFCTIPYNHGHKPLLKAWFIFHLVHLKGVDKWNNLSRNAFC